MDLAGKIQDLEKRLVKYKKALADDVLAFGSARNVVPASDMEAGLKCLKTAVALKAQGLTFRKIAEKVGYDNSSIAGWFSRGQLPGKLCQLYNLLDMPRDFSPEFAYFLGVYSAMNMVGGKYRSILFTACEPAVLRKLKRSFEKIWPGRWNKNKVYQGTYHPDIVRHIRLITSHNTQVPWEHLGTVAEKKSYLRGIFYSRGSSESDNNGFFITKSSRSFLEEFMVLLAEFNILGALHKTTNSKCVSFYSSDLARLLKLGVLPKAKKDVFADFEANPDEDSVSDYYSVRIYKDAYALDFLCEKFGFAFGTIRDWIKKESRRPKQVSKYLAIEKLRNQFDRNSVSFLYRNCGLDSRQSRALARDFSIDDLKETYPEGTAAAYGNAGRIIEDVVAFKRREIREFRCATDSFNPDRNASLYEKICVFSKMFSKNPRMCRCYADSLSADYKIPAKFIYEFLVGEKPLKVL